MALNVTKILFRRGTEAQRRTIQFEFGEPAYAYDTRRLFIGDGVTPGGVSLGMRNHGSVPNLSGNYLNTCLSETAFTLLTSGAVQIGDIVYDRTTSYVFSLTSATTYPNLSNFQAYAVFPEIQTNDFIYSGTKLSLANNSIQSRHINTASINGQFLSGGNGVPITVKPGTLINTLFSNQTPANSIKANTTNGLTTPTDLVIGSPCQVAGRGGASSTLSSVTLVGTGSIKVDGVDNEIRIFNTPTLPLTGGIMAGGVNMQTFAISATRQPFRPTELANKEYVDTIPSVAQARIVYDWIQANFLPLTGAAMSGNLSLNSTRGASANLPLRISDSNHWIAFNSNTSAGSWNPLVQANDKSLIFSNGTINTGSLVIAPQSATEDGIRILSNGFVGIADATPEYRLDVNGDVATNGWLRTRGNVGWYNQTHGGGWFMTDANWIRAYNNKSVWVEGTSSILATAGRIGAGTSTPSEKLDVQGNINISGNITKQGSIKPATWGGGLTTFDVYSDSGSIGAGVGGTLRAWINASGDGYIGNNLTVDGEVISKGLAGAAGQARYIAGNRAAFIRNDGTDFYILKTAANSPLGSWDTTRPFAINLGSGHVGLAFDGTTRVGIGIGPWGLNASSPKLTVSGDIAATGNISAGSNWRFIQGSYTIEDKDCGDTVAISGSTAAFITVPNNNFRKGFQITIVRWQTSSLTVKSNTGVKVNQAYGLYRLAGRYSAATLMYSGDPSNGWVLFGDLTR